MVAAVKICQGKGRELQDRADYFFMSGSLVIIVADGAGGMSGGAEAADFAVKQASKGVNTEGVGGDSLVKILMAIDREMSGAGTFGETTCVIVTISNGTVSGASAGDSGAWLVSGADVDDLTGEQRRKPFLGSGFAMPVSFKRDKFKGTLLVASDGLLKYTSPEKIAAAAKESDLELAASKLIELVRYPSGNLPDDVAVVLARNS